MLQIFKEKIRDILFSLVKILMFLGIICVNIGSFIQAFFGAKQAFYLQGFLGEILYFIAMVFATLCAIFMFKKFQSKLYMKAYEYYKKSAKDKEKFEKSGENMGFEMLLKIFNLSKAEFKSANLKKAYKEFAKKFRPDLAPLHKTKEARESFVNLQKIIYKD